MSEQSLSKKLQIKPEHQVLAVNWPKGFDLGPLPAGARLAQKSAGPFDVVLGFVKDQADLARHAPDAMKALKPLGALWLAYPKKTSSVKTDLSRDVGWDVMTQAGWRIVSLVALDDTWSAARFRPKSEVGK
jgi:hypothetical protein